MAYRSSNKPAVCVQCGKPLDPTRRTQYCEACQKMRRQLRAVLYQRRMRKLKKDGQKAPAVKERPAKVVACLGCVYYKSIAHAGQMCACHYAIETGKLRGIPASKCYRHRGTPYKRKEAEK